MCKYDQDEIDFTGLKTVTIAYMVQWCSGVKPIAMFNVSAGHKYFSHETTKLPAIFHYEVIIMLPYVCLHQQDAYAHSKYNRTESTCV